MRTTVRTPFRTRVASRARETRAAARRPRGATVAQVGVWCSAGAHRPQRALRATLGTPGRPLPCIDECCGRGRQLDTHEGVRQFLLPRRMSELSSLFRVAASGLSTRFFSQITDAHNCSHPLPNARRIASSGDARSCARARTRTKCPRGARRCVHVAPARPGLRAQAARQTEPNATRLSFGATKRQRGVV